MEHARRAAISAALSQTLDQAYSNRERAAHLRDTAARERARAEHDSAMAERERKIVERLARTWRTPLVPDHAQAPGHDRAPERAEPGTA